MGFALGGVGNVHRSRALRPVDEALLCRFDRRYPELLSRGPRPDGWISGSIGRGLCRRRIQASFCRGRLACDRHSGLHSGCSPSSAWKENQNHRPVDGGVGIRYGHEPDDGLWVGSLARLGFKDLQWRDPPLFMGLLEISSI